MEKLYYITNSCSLAEEDISGHCKLSLYDGTNQILDNPCSSYIYESGCTDSSRLNMSTSDYSLAMAFSAILIVSIFSYSILSNLRSF